MVVPLLLSVLLRQGADAPNLIAASGSGQIVVPADQASVYVEGEALTSDPLTATKAAEDVRHRIKETAQKIVADSALYRQFDPVLVPPVEANASSSPSNYLVRAGLRIDGIALSKTAPLLTALEPLKGSNGISLDYGLKDPSAARRAVLHAAFLDAKVKAQEAADAAGLKLGDVFVIEAGDGAKLSPVYEDHGGGIDPHPVLLKSLRAVAAITVRFRLVK